MATGPFQVPRVPPIAAAPGPRRRAVPQHRVPPARSGARRPGARGRRRQHGLSDRRGARARARGALSIGSRQTPLPQRIAGRDLFRYLDALGLMRVTVESRLGAAAALPRHADRLQPARRARALRHPHACARDRGAGHGGACSRTAAGWRRRGDLGDGLRGRPQLGAACRSSTTPRGSMHHRGVTCSPGLYFLGLHLAVHARIGAAGLGQGRCRVHRRSDRRARRAHRRLAARPSNALALAGGEHRIMTTTHTSSASPPARESASIRAPMLWGIGVGLLQAATPWPSGGWTARRSTRSGSS